MARTGLVLTGVTGNYASTPDHADLDIVGDLDIRFYGIPDDYTPTTSMRIVQKGQTVNELSYLLRLETAGTLRLYWSEDGVAWAFSEISSVALSTSAIGGRATLQASSGDVTFYEDIGNGFVTLGVIQTGVATSIFSSTAYLAVGGSNTQSFTGSIQYVEIRDGINGTIVANPDFRAQPSGTTEFTDDFGKPWTVTSVVDTDEPVILPHDGNHYVYFPETNENWMTATSVSQVGVTTTTLLFKFSEILEPDHQSYFYEGTSGSNRFRIFGYTGPGDIRVETSKDSDGAAHNVTSSTITDFDEHKWFRFDITLGTGDVRYRASKDALSTAEGSVVYTFDETKTLSEASKVPVSTTAGLGGSLTGTSVITGSMHYFRMDHDGTPVTVFDPATDIDTWDDPDAGQDTITSSATGEVWTVNRTTTAPRTVVVTRPTWVVNASEWMQSAYTPTITATTGQLSFAWCGRLDPNFSDWSRIMSAESATNDGIYLAVNNGDKLLAYVSDGTTTASALSDTTVMLVNDLVAAVVVYDAGDLTLYASDGTASTAATYGGTDPAFNPFRFGALGYGVSSPGGLETMCNLIFADVALSQEEAEAIMDEMIQGRYL